MRPGGPTTQQNTVTLDGECRIAGTVPELLLATLVKPIKESGGGYTQNRMARCFEDVPNETGTEDWARRTESSVGSWTNSG